MDAALKDKLLKDLHKAGFESEMRAMAEIQKTAWSCSGSTGYFDEDEKITRSIDIRADLCRRKYNGDNMVCGIEYHIFAEVKKSERPWVVFAQSDRKIDGDGWSNPHMNVNIKNISPLTPILREYSIRKELGWIGRGVHEAFKEPQLAGRWYSAAVTTCKAANSFVRQEWADYAKKDTGACLYITHPIVILDGPLVSAKLSEDGEVILTEIPYAPFVFEFGTSAYKLRTYRVDLISIGSIGAFLEKCRSRVEYLYDELEDAASAGKAE